jgi:hypothetical protein
MNSLIYTHFRNIGWDKAKMILIADVDVLDRRELLQREKEEITKYIKDESCLNHNLPLICEEEKKQRDKEYGKKRRTEQKEKERQRVAAWRANNPEKHAAQVRRSVEKQRAKKNLE